MSSGLLTPAIFRQALGHFATGVTVVTAEYAPKKVHGMTANSFASVSLHPLLISICVDQQARMLGVLGSAGRFGVNVLKNDQRGISEFFAQTEQDPATEPELGVQFEWTPSGIPLLAGTLARLGCYVVATHRAGDHTIFIGEVETAELSEGEPLLFFRGNYREIAPRD